MALGFKEVTGFIERIVEEADKAGKEELAALVADLKSAIAQVETDALKAVAASSPDVQAAVQNVLKLAEQALLAALAAHGL